MKTKIKNFRCTEEEEQMLKRACSHANQSYAQLLMELVKKYCEDNKLETTASNPVSCFTKAENARRWRSERIVGLCDQGPVKKKDLMMAAGVSNHHTMDQLLHDLVSTRQIFQLPKKEVESLRDYDVSPGNTTYYATAEAIRKMTNQEEK